MTTYKEIFKRGQFHLTEDEIKRLIQATKKFNGSYRLRNRIIVKLLAYQGMRRFEVAKIKIDEIDLTAKTIRVLGKKNIFRVALIYREDLLDDLKEYVGNRESGHLFASRSRPNSHIDKVQINRILEKTGNFAGVKNPTPGLKHINPHILRHSCARILKDKGLSMESVQSVLGHISYKTTMDVYGTKSVLDVEKELEEKTAGLFT